MIGSLAAAAQPASADVSDLKINEVESNGGTPGDWVEVINNGTTPVDVSGFTFRDNDPTHTQYAIPAGTTLAPGAYYVLEEAAFGFGLGAPVANVKLNEVESSGGSPGDWVELRNNGATTADVSGYRFIDNDDTHTAYAIPAGTTIAAGGYLVLEEAAFGFGLGAADSAPLFGRRRHDGRHATPGRRTPRPRTAAAPTEPGRSLTTQAPTKGAANVCAGDVPASPWPGGAAVAIADDAGVFGGNISGLAYESSGTDAPGVLWVGQERTGNAVPPVCGTARSGRRTPRTTGARARRCATRTAPATRMRRA